MRFNCFRAVQSSLVVVCGVLLSLTANAQDSTVVVTKDSIISESPKGEVTYRNLLYFSGLYLQNTNDEFYDNMFPNGLGVQLGIPLYSHNYYTIRFNAGFQQYAVDKDAYMKKDSAAVSVNTTALQTVSLMPDVIFHPFDKWVASPYVSAGVGLLVGSKNPSATASYANNPEQKSTITFGTRYIAQFGAGATVRLSNHFNVLLGAAYNLEFLENNEPEDIFYNFEKPKDYSYKYLQYQVGLQVKWKNK